MSDCGPESVSILHIEDDEVDRQAVERGLRKLGLNSKSYAAADGREALRMLRGEGGVPAIRAPHLILLDLKMSGMNGHEFLAEVRRDERLRESIIFVLTTSDHTTDRQLAYRRNVAGYLLKTPSSEEFLENLRLIRDYIRRVRFPPVR